MPAPWINCGQKMSQYPALRLSVPRASSSVSAADSHSPSVRSFRGSNLPVISPVRGIAKNDPMPRGAIAMPA